MFADESPNEVCKPARFSRGPTAHLAARRAFPRSKTHSLNTGG